MNPETAASFREQLIEIAMRGGATRTQAEVWLARVGDRLRGYTHDEVVEMHPMPPPAQQEPK